MIGIFCRFEEAPLRHFDHLPHIEGEIVFWLRGRVANDGEHSEVDVWEVVREPMAPRAHTALVERIGSFCCQKNGNRCLTAHGLTNLTSAGWPATSKRVGLSNSTSTKCVMFSAGSGLMARILPSTSRAGNDGRLTRADWPTRSSEIIWAATWISAIIRSSLANRARTTPPGTRSPKRIGIAETTPAVVARTTVASACPSARS